MTKLQTKRIEGAVMAHLHRKPLTVPELTVALHRDDAVPVWWGVDNVRPILRRLHGRGWLNRLTVPVTRTHLWWWT